MHSYAVLDNRLTIIAHLKHSNKALYIIFTLNRFLISKHGIRAEKFSKQFIIMNENPSA